jgi:hypothetical protein
MFRESDWLWAPLETKIDFQPFGFRSAIWRDVLDTTFCDKVCQLLAAISLWLSQGTMVSPKLKIE